MALRIHLPLCHFAAEDKGDSLSRSSTNMSMSSANKILGGPTTGEAGKLEALLFCGTLWQSPSCLIKTMRGLRWPQPREDLRRGGQSVPGE
jgi:hypothetical protein